MVVVSELIHDPTDHSNYWAAQPYPSCCNFGTNEIHSPHPPGHSQEVLPTDSELAAKGKGAPMKLASSHVHSYRPTATLHER